MSLAAKSTLGLLAMCLLSACATGPKFNAQGVDTSLTPQRAMTDIDSLREARIIWGGVILASTNLKDTTQIEVLGYPLDSAFRPDIDAVPTARFLIIKPGCLETADYMAGRPISTSGVLKRVQAGQVGEVSYAYPVIEPTDIYLWPRDSGESHSNVHFGFGVNILR
ncbi:MAG: Slp family lipoprotein [Pseudomonadota bacterium]